MTKGDMMQAPFPWFGGKRKVASEVWAAMGDVDNYVEPFAGSLAVLLERPAWHAGKVETVNDADQYLANFWRALSCDPDAVAYHADWPVNEADLFARHLWLVNQGKAQLQVGMVDPDWYDAKIAGWWLWGICQWIGSGWCSGTGPWSVQDGQLVHLGNAGMGINRKRVHLGNAGRGINRQLVHLGNAGQGVNRQLVHLGNAGRGDGMPVNQALYGYMYQLAERLRGVRVVCGDWARVVTNGALSYGATVGVFLDPPYSDAANRDMTLYSVDSGTIAHDVREWCLANGDNPRYRIVLAGYEDEHAAHMPPTWRVMNWKANVSFQSSRADGANQTNRHKERLWFSPHCIRVAPTLFEAAD